MNSSVLLDEETKNTAYMDKRIKTSVKLHIIASKIQTTIEMSAAGGLDVYTVKNLRRLINEYWAELEIIEDYKERVHVFTKSCDQLLSGLMPYDKYLVVDSLKQTKIK